MDIKVLGSGCKKCIQLENNVKDALVTLDIDASVEHITDFEKIVSYGVMSTPALVVDGKVLLSGRVPNVKKLQGILK